MLTVILDVVGPITLIVALGWWYSGKLHADMSFANRANMDVFTPALIFSALTGNAWSLQQEGWLLLAAAIIVVLSGLLSLPFIKLTKTKWQVLIPPVMFSNSGNLGIPLVLFAFGEQLLPIAVLLFIVENTLHFTLGLSLMSPGNVIKSLVRSPIIWATVVALLMKPLELTLPNLADRTIDLLGQVAIPLMLFALGVRMRGMKLEHWKLPLFASLWIPLIGLLIALPLIWLFPLTEQQVGLLLIFSVLPPAVLNFLVAERYLSTDEEKHQVATIVLWGNLSSIVTMSLVLTYVLA